MYISRFKLNKTALRLYFSMYMDKCVIYFAFNATLAYHSSVTSKNFFSLFFSEKIGGMSHQYTIHNQYSSEYRDMFVHNKVLIQLAVKQASL